MGVAKSDLFEGSTTAGLGRYSEIALETRGAQIALALSTSIKKLPLGGFSSETLCNDRASLDESATSSLCGVRPSKRKLLLWEDHGCLRSSY